MIDYNICAVVVTYNRLELLKECIQALRNQTRKLNEIIVVNNDSKDGTKEWLEEQKDITKIHQENLGGAGGFHNGMKAAYEKGYDWIWLMDDDGKPDILALEKLCETISNYQVDATGCFNIENKESTELPSNLHIELFDGENISVTKVDEFVRLANSDGLVWRFVNMFNGVLLSKSLIKKIGLPKKEMIIWGDEVEYSRRIKEAKLKVATNINAKFYHPKNKWEFKAGLFGRILFTGEVDWKAYYFFRNRAYLARKDFRLFNIKFVIAQSWYYLQKIELSSLLFFLNAYKDGLLKNLTSKKIL